MIQYRPIEVAKLKTQLVGTYVYLYGFSGNTPFKNWDRVKILDVDFEDHNDSYGTAEYTLTVQIGKNRRCFVGYDPIHIAKDSKIKNTWPKAIIKAIQGASLVIGMNAEQIVASIGEPEEVKKTTTTNGISEQWIYRDGNYLYLKNGILTTIQSH